MPSGEAKLQCLKKGERTGATMYTVSFIYMSISFQSFNKRMSL